MEWKLHIKLLVKDKISNENIIGIETLNHMANTDGVSEAYIKRNLINVCGEILLLHATVGNCFVTEERADALGLMLQMSHERMDFMLDVFNGVRQIS